MNTYLLVVVFPLLLAVLIVLLVPSLFRALMQGICSQCGEHLPHRGFVRCPWCHRVSFRIR